MVASKTFKILILLLMILAGCKNQIQVIDDAAQAAGEEANNNGSGNSNTVDLNFSSSADYTFDPNIEFLPTGAHIADNPTPIDGTLDSAPEFANGVADNTSFNSGITLNTVSSTLGPTTAPQWANLVGYFTFDATIAGNSKGSLSMTTSNAYVNSLSKVAGNSSADLSDYDGFISINDHSDIDFTDEFSISFWFRKIQVAYSRRILMKGDSGNASPYTLIYNYCGAAFSGTLSLVLNGSAVITTACIDFTKTWNHIAVTYQKSLGSGQAKIYLDGEVIGSGAYSTTLTTNNMPLVFSGGEEFSGSWYKLSMAMDELMLWNTGLSADEIKDIFNKQRVNYGTYTSEVINYGTVKNHTTFSWVTDLPYGKELPADRLSEKTSDYSALVGSTSSLNDDNLLSNLEVYYDFNGAVGTLPTGTTILDKSGFARNFSTGAGTTIRAKTRFREGVSGYHTLSSLSMAAPMTFSMWVAPAYYSSLNPFINGISNNAVSIYLSHGLSITTVNFTVNTASNTDTTLTCTGIKTAKDGMMHIAATFDATSLKLYLNGNLCQSATGRNNTFSTTTFTSYMGMSNGLMDEFAIWRRELQASEVMQLYKRGSSTAKFQVRSCDDPLCSGESWMGPDGSSNTFFSEFYNSNDGFPAGLLSASSKTLDTKPVMTFADFPTPPADAQYFQWRAILESFVEENNCDGAFCKPLIQSVATADAVLAYPIGSYYVQNAASISFSKIKYLVITEGVTAGCTYRFRVSNNGGASFLYYNGSAWVASASDTDASTISQVMSRISSLPVGGGEFVIRSIIQSNGTSDCSIESITIEKEN